MSHSAEHASQPEGEPPAPSIRLEFFRHDEKEKETTAGNREGDERVRLTYKGRMRAAEAGKTRNSHPEVGLVYGSLRDRSTEAALRQLFANEKSVMAEDSLEDIYDKVGSRLRVGRKNSKTSNLDFGLSGSQEYHDALYGRLLGPSKDLLVFMYEESDALVRKTRDMKSVSYSRLAGNIAELVKRYLDVLPRWEQIAAEKPEEYAKYNNELQRFFGSHQTVLEPFLMKVIEKSEGKEGVQELLKSLPDKNGFGYSQGFSVKISRSKSSAPIAVVSYNGKEWELALEVVEEIIAERNALNEEVERGRT